MISAILDGYPPYFRASRICLYSQVPSFDVARASPRSLGHFAVFVFILTTFRRSLRTSLCHGRAETSQFSPFHPFRSPEVYKNFTHTHIAHASERIVFCSAVCVLRNSDTVESLRSTRHCCDTHIVASTISQKQKIVIQDSSRNCTSNIREYTLRPGCCEDSLLRRVF